MKPNLFTLIFISITCSVFAQDIEIRKDGTIPNKLIMFRGDLGSKMVGASLPSDYEVDE